MKRTIIILLFSSVAVVAAVTNVPGPIGLISSNSIASTNVVHALPTTIPVSSLAGYLSLVIPIVVPALLAGLKSWIPKLPAWILPILAPTIGAIMDWVMQLSGLNTNGAIVGALLGSAGVGLRELQDQIKQRMASPPPPTTPVVVPSPPKP